MTDAEANIFGERYAAAWSSGSPAKVCAMFAPDGSIAINGGPASHGPDGIGSVVQSWMDAFPDLRITCERMGREGEAWKWFWRMRGTFSGPGGNGRRVDMRGWEVLSIAPDGRIRHAEGHYNQAEYNRQLGIQ